MPLLLRAATPADVRRMADIYFAAFAGNAINTLIFPPADPASHVFWQDLLAKSVADTQSHVSVMQTDDGQVAAFAIWVAPRGAADDLPPMAPPEVFPAAGSRSAAVSFFSDLHAQHRRFMTGPDGSHVPHWYLELIATDPDFQGQGAAGTLLRWGEARADAANVPCYLDATPDGRPVYASGGHAFVEVDARTYLDGTYEHVFMVRPARG